MEDSSYLRELNDAQRAAVLHQAGPALVIAGAGSGKTRVLVYKIIHLLHSGYQPDSLMALTFTNKAAREMRSRIEAQVGASTARRLRMGTFHSIFLRILRQHADLLGYTSDFSIYNTSDVKSRLKAIIKDMGLDDKIYKPQLVQSKISRAKNNLLSPEGYRNQHELVRQDIKQGVHRISDIYLRYAHELRQSNAMDFDDLLLQINILFRDHAQVLQYWQERIEYLLIDEYQDTNIAQYMIARALMGDRGNIFVVGDDAQSIYSFRGANIKNMLGFSHNFPGTKVFRLEENYRSTQTIVQAANAVIAHNRDQLPKEVFSSGPVGEPIEIHEAINAEAEAMWVQSSIERMRRSLGASYSDFAILYRTRAQSRMLELVLRRSQTPFKIYGGMSFFEHKEIMDVMAYLRLLTNEQDGEAMLRIINYPKRGIGSTTLERIRQVAQQSDLPLMTVVRDPEAYSVDVSRGAKAKLEAFVTLIDNMRAQLSSDKGQGFYQAMERIIRQTGIIAELSNDKTDEGISKVDNVNELLTSIAEYETRMLEDADIPSLSHYISEVSLLTDQDTQEQESMPSVTLMTIHASKGLEFRHLFIVGLEEGLFPSGRSMEERELEEERRLFYVAITRAEETCAIGYAKERMRNGTYEHTSPSRFLRELPPNLLTNRAPSLSFPKATRGVQQSYIGDELPTTFSRHEALSPPSPSAKKPQFTPRALDYTPATADDLYEGCRVRHPKLGEGTVSSISETAGEAKADVYFDDLGLKSLILRFARLELLD